MKNIAIFLSGRGSNFVAIKEKIDSGYITGAKIAVVFSNNPNAKGLEYAESCGIPTICIPSKGRADREAYDNEVISALEPYNIDLVCLAGYMRIVSMALVEKFENRMINIHPSLLPAFVGLDAQTQAFDYGVKVSGCTVHFVDGGLDSGAIILQKVVDISGCQSADEVSTKILKLEHSAYSEAIKLFIDGRLSIHGRRVEISAE